VASRTDTPSLALKALKFLKMPPTGAPAETFFDSFEIYPGNLSWKCVDDREQMLTFSGVGEEDGD
jgi:hypothetical protein